MTHSQVQGAMTGPASTAAIDWAKTLAQHDRWLRTVVLARLGERQAVDEVMQEVCLAAVEQKAPLSDPTKVAPWLYRLAVLQSLLYRRQRGRSRKLTDRYAERVQPREEDSRAPDALDWLLADERKKLVRTALEKMPSRDGEILLLKYGEDWSYQQIADHLGVSHSAAESRLHRARLRLRNELAALNVTEDSPR